MPAAKKQVPKSITHQLNALEDHLATLVPMVTGLHSGDAAYGKDIATKLRLLICGSSGQQGLLWDVNADVGANDIILTRVGEINSSNPITKGLLLFDTYKLLNLEGTPFPLRSVSLRQFIEDQELSFIDGKSVTYRDVIKEMAEHSGTAHETPGVSVDMAKANAISIGNAHPYLPMLDRVARWTWSVGESVLSTAVENGYVRRRPQAIPPPPIDLETKAFQYPVDGPKLDVTCDRGTVFMVLSAQPFADAKRFRKAISLAPLTMGKIVFSFTATRRGKLLLKASGLRVPNFGYEGTVNGSTNGQVKVSVVWEDFDVRVYLNGAQVQGSTSKEK